MPNSCDQENINMIVLFQNNQILQGWLSVVSFCNIFKHKSFAFTTSSHKKLSLFIDRCYPEKQFYNNETKNKPSLNEIMSWFRHPKFGIFFFMKFWTLLQAICGDFFLYICIFKNVFSISKNEYKSNKYKEPFTCVPEQLKGSQQIQH